MNRILGLGLPFRSLIRLGVRWFCIRHGGACVHLEKVLAASLSHDQVIGARRHHKTLAQVLLTKGKFGPELRVKTPTHQVDKDPLKDV